MESVKNIKEIAWSLEKISKQVLDSSMVPEFIKDKKKKINPNMLHESKHY
jgi:hypothetical protein